MVEPRFLDLNDCIAASIQTAIDTTFVSAFQLPTCVDLCNIGRHVDLGLQARHAAQIQLTDNGVPFGAFIAAFKRPLLLKVLNLPDEQKDLAMIDDAAGEITNMIYGLFKTSVNGNGYGLTMGIPQLIHEQDMNETGFVQSEKLRIDFLADGQECWIAIAQYH
ncbi:MAG: chemotaxis protein CheX [Alphaproteobacteria bacterium]|nr:chemotaxis protein CheX [Alphaproteobacteria bacterium]